MEKEEVTVKINHFISTAQIARYFFIHAQNYHRELIISVPRTSGILHRCSFSPFFTFSYLTLS